MRFWTIVFLVVLAMIFCAIALSQTFNDTAIEQVAVQHLPTLDGTQTLFGEPVPANATTKDTFQHELRWEMDHASVTALKCERLSELDQYISAILAKHKLHNDFKYLFTWESSLDPMANSGLAVGFAQFRSSTARRYGLDVVIGSRNGKWDIDQRKSLMAFDAASEYLEYLQKRFGISSLTAAAYNAGEAGIARILKEQGVDDYWELFSSRQNEHFLYDILALKTICEQHLVRYTPRPPIQFKFIVAHLRRPMTLHDFFLKHGYTENDFADNIRWNKHIREGVIPPYKNVRIYVQEPLAK